MKSYLFYPVILVNNLSYGSSRSRPEATVTSLILSGNPKMTSHFTYGLRASPVTANASTSSRKALVHKELNLAI